jgi:hypothetical protein
MDARRRLHEEQLDRVERRGPFGSLTLPGWSGWGPGQTLAGSSYASGWRRVGYVLLCLGIAATIGWVVYAINAQANHLDGLLRVPASTGETIQISADGDYTVWTIPDPNTLPIQSPPQAALTFRGPDGAEVEMVMAEPPTAYRRNATHEGYVVGTVDFPTAGTYSLVERELSAPDTDLGLGEGDGMPVGIVKPALAIALLTAAASAVCLMIASRVSRRRIEETSKAVASLGPNNQD